MLNGVPSMLGKPPSQMPQSRRAVTVADSIQMTYIGSPDSRYSDSPAAIFSPNGKQFVVVTRRGNIANNANEYSLLLFHSADALRGAKPQVLLNWSSSSNRPAIDAVQWMHDSETIVFLGTRQDQREDMYALNVRTGRLRLVCAAQTDIASFGTTENLATLAFLAYPSQKKTLRERDRESGLVVSSQHIVDLISGHESELEFIHPFELFVKRRGSVLRRVDLQGDHPLGPPFVSPDGRYAVVQVFVGTIPKSWYGYKDAKIQAAISEAYAARYDLIDCQTGAVRPLLNAPTLVEPEIAWSSDGKSVVVAETYLPIEDNISPSADAKTFVVEVEIVAGTITRIAPGSLHLLRWDSNSNTVMLSERQQTELMKSDAGATERASGVVAYRKIHGRWEQMGAATLDDSGSEPMNFTVEEEEDMNTAPRLVVVDGRTQKKSLLLDLNPQFKDLRFGTVQEISWKLRDGHQATGGLYLPPNYVPGKRYALVIQTHGWNPHQFWIDGESTAGYAAQALLTKGIIVAQIPMSPEFQTIEEGPRQIELYETLIDYLDERGMIDLARVGLLGWSRTGYHVRYALTASKYHFAAAVIADPTDDGYVHYMIWLNQGPARAKIYESMVGGAPFGDGLQAWVKQSTGFRLDQVHTPVRLLSFGQYSPFTNWEWFAGLRYLGKPVELVWLPDAKHMPVKPSERMTAQQGDVDWFCFWLLSEEDPDRSKREQYGRWRRLREQHTAGFANN
jgi:hypothetical protein